MSEIDYERYRYHYGLLRDRYSDRQQERLSMLATWIFQPIMGTAVGMLETTASLLELTLEDVADIPPSVREFQRELEAAVNECREIHTSIVIDWYNLTDESIQTALNAYWEKRAISEKLLRLPQQMRETEADLRPIYPHFDMSLGTLERNTRIIQVAFEVLANPDEPNVPADLIYWSQTMNVLMYLTHDVMQNPEKTLDGHSLEQLLRASQHPLLAIRLDATRALGCSPDAKSIEALVRLITDAEFAVRKAAAVALGVIGSRWRSDDERIVEALNAARDDTSHDVSAEASRSLKHIRESRL